jgi:hypothetical protein
MAVKRLLVRIAYIDGRASEYPITPRLQMMFERTYKITFNQLDENVTNRYQLAWAVQKEHQADMPEGFMPGLDEWADTLVGIEVDSEDVVPFVSAPANGGSANSPSLQALATVT